MEQHGRYKAFYFSQVMNMKLKMLAAALVTTFCVGAVQAADVTAQAVMIDTANGVLGGNLSALSNGYNQAGRATAQDGFNFSIISGTADGTNAVNDYSTLPEGIWSGDVSVQFDATWTS